MQENLKKKYGITDEQLKRAVDQIQFGKIACDGIVLVALVELCADGKPEKTVNPARGAVPPYRLRPGHFNNSFEV